ncbi:MAG: MlaA family lipoprotein [Syntrophobacteraceae bacterium]
MRKITWLKITFLLLFLSVALGFQIQAYAQIFTDQQQTLSSEQELREPKVSDPFQKSNQKIFSFNDWLYTQVITPITNAYDKIPVSVRTIFRNGFENLEDPARFVNFVLQARPTMAGNTMSRFIINSTVGVGGMFDVAKNALGVKRVDSDFGQTLGVWGVAPGPYLVVPGLGPSDIRDLVGFATDSVMDPLFWVPGPFWTTIPADTVDYIGKAADNIDSYETMKKAALYPYVSMRNGYMQYRDNLVDKGVKNQFQ